MKKGKKELLLMAVILLIAAAGFFINYLTHRHPAAAAEVSVDGQTTAVYDLSRDLETTIQGYDGGTNHLVIQDGVLWIDEATCPDKVCIHQGKISMNGELVVCLPNRVIVKIKEQEPAS